MKPDRIRAEPPTIISNILGSCETSRPYKRKRATDRQKRRKGSLATKGKRREQRARRPVQTQEEVSRSNCILSEIQSFVGRDNGLGEQEITISSHRHKKVEYAPSKRLEMAHWQAIRRNRTNIGLPPRK